LAVSLITIAEIEYGMEAKNWGAGPQWSDAPLSRPFYSAPAG